MEKVREELEAVGHEVMAVNGERAKMEGRAEAWIIDVREKVDGERLRRMPRLKYIVTMSVGTDHVSRGEAFERGVRVVNAPGANAEAVAEHVMEMELMLLRQTLAQMESLKQGAWRKRRYMGEELKDKKVGVIGMGAVGRQVAKKLAAWGVATILGYDPYVAEREMKWMQVEKLNLRDLLKVSELVSIHVPLNEETKDLITLREMMWLGEKGRLVNVSRGEVVNEADLIKALKEGMMAGAAMDVFVNEPEVNPDLLGCPNLIATPHVGAYTIKAREQMQMMAVRNFLELAGKEEEEVEVIDSKQVDSRWGVAV